MPYCSIGGDHDLDSPNSGRNLHRSRNQRLPSGRILISVNLTSPAAERMEATGAALKNRTYRSVFRLRGTSGFIGTHNICSSIRVPVRFTALAQPNDQEKAPVSRPQQSEERRQLKDEGVVRKVLGGELLCARHQREGVHRSDGSAGLRV